MFHLTSHNNKSVIGLDVGVATVRMLQLEATPGGGTRVTAGGRRGLPATLPLTGERREAAVADAVAALLEEGDFVGRRVVSSLPAGALQYKNVRLPRMPAEELTAAVEWEAAERLGAPRESASIQFYDAGEVRQGAELRREIILMAAPESLIETHTRMLLGCGLEPIAIDATPSALGRWLNHVAAADRVARGASAASASASDSASDSDSASASESASASPSTSDSHSAPAANPTTAPNSTANAPSHAPAAQSAGATRTPPVRCVIDVGYASTKVVMFRGEQVLFFKLIDVAGRHFDQAVATARGIGQPEAAKLRRKAAQRTAPVAYAGSGMLDAALRGGAHESGQNAGQNTGQAGGQDAGSNPILEAMQKPAAELGREIGLCLRYFGVTFRGERPDEVVLVGGEAGSMIQDHGVEDVTHADTLQGETGATGGLAGMLCEQAGLPVHTVDPLSGFDLSNVSEAASATFDGRGDYAASQAAEGRGGSSHRGEWAVAAGLSLRPWGRASASARPAWFKRLAAGRGAARKAAQGAAA